jgi:hypothetical protein
VNHATRTSYHRLNLRCQLIDCLAHGLIEDIHLFSVHPSVKSVADVGAGQSELDIIRLVEHRILYTYQPAIYQSDGVNTP